MMLARMIKIFFVIKMLKIGLGAAASAEVLNVAGETPATTGTCAIADSRL